MSAVEPLFAARPYLRAILRTRAGARGLRK